MSTPALGSQLGGEAGETVDPSAAALTDALFPGVVLGPVRARHGFESCVERLATAIRLGALPTGSPLPPERELAEQLGVSRATVREAIAALRAADMVTTRRGRGGGTVVVRRPDVPGRGGRRALAARREELADALVFRRVVEPGGCHAAAGRTLGDHSRALLTDALQTVSAATDPAEHRQADTRLHLAIAHVTESPLIIEAVTTVQAALHSMLVAIPVLPVNIEHSDAQHATVVAAILAGDGRRARTAMEDHCDDTAALLRGLLG